jgi:hypothetical protein
LRRSAIASKEVVIVWRISEDCGSVEVRVGTGRVLM